MRCEGGNERLGLEVMSGSARAAAFGIDAVIVRSVTATLCWLITNALPRDPELASLFFHIARALIGAAFCALMLRYLSGTMGHVACRGAVIVAFHSLGPNASLESSSAT